MIESTVPHYRIPARHYFRGRVLLAAGRAEDTATAFRLDGRPRQDPTVTGYQDAFGTWKDADADLPLLVEAKKGYAQLN